MDKKLLNPRDSPPEIQRGEQLLELVDGDGKVPAVMTRAASLARIQCDPGKHCAHHGSGPFFCCRCAAEFKYA